MSRRADVALLGAAALLAACQGEVRPAAAGLVDDAGRGVALDPPAQRIVSLSPATTELLFALGAGERVVGRTRWCVDPVAAVEIPSVGDGLDPNVEVIVSREPDLVLFYDSPGNAGARQQLTDLGIATAAVRLDGSEDLARAARLLGALTGTAERAETLVAAFEREVAALQATRPAEGPTVLLLAWHDPPIVVGSGSFLSEIVTLAGGTNAFADIARPSATVSLEAIAARQPEWLVVTAGEEEPAVAARPEWQTVLAVRERRYALVDGTEFSHPSFRLPAAVRQLRRALGLEGR